MVQELVQIDQMLCSSEPFKWSKVDTLAERAREILHSVAPPSSSKHTASFAKELGKAVLLRSAFIASCQGRFDLERSFLEQSRSYLEEDEELEVLRALFVNDILSGKGSESFSPEYEQLFSQDQFACKVWSKFQRNMSQDNPGDGWIALVEGVELQKQGQLESSLELIGTAVDLFHADKGQSRDDGLFVGLTHKCLLNASLKEFKSFDKDSVDSIKLATDKVWQDLGYCFDLISMEVDSRLDGFLVRLLSAMS
jgi:hypothetical protein